MTPQLFPGEALLIESAANLFRGLEGVGGKMRVTNRRIIFEPHALNIQSHPEIIPLEEIASAALQNTWGFLRNRLVIRVRSGQEFHFITWKREKIIAALQSQLPALTLQR